MDNTIIMNQGYIALISILIISSLLAIIASSASLISISESKTGLKESQSWEAFYLATACAEDALMKLKEDINYPGGETLTFESGTCYIAFVEGTGENNRVVKTSGTVLAQIRKIRIEIEQINPEMAIKSWQEVSEF